jgi:hypothetical protein
MTYFMKKETSPLRRAALQIFVNKTPNKEEPAQNKDKYLF